MVSKAREDLPEPERDVEVHVLEVVLAGAADADQAGHGGTLGKRRGGAAFALCSGGSGTI
jgi:hypothetical protein